MNAPITETQIPHDMPVAIKPPHNHDMLWIFDMIAEDSTKKHIWTSILIWILDKRSRDEIRSRFLHHYKINLLVGEKMTFERFTSTPTWKESKFRAREIQLYHEIFSDAEPEKFYIFLVQLIHNLIANIPANE